jgi:hypothetical protein
MVFRNFFKKEQGPPNLAVAVDQLEMTIQKLLKAGNIIRREKDGKWRILGQEITQSQINGLLEGKMIKEEKIFSLGEPSKVSAMSGNTVTEKLLKQGNVLRRQSDNKYRITTHAIEPELVEEMLKQGLVKEEQVYSTTKN